MKVIGIILILSFIPKTCPSLTIPEYSKKVSEAIEGLIRNEEVAGLPCGRVGEIGVDNRWFREFLERGGEKDEVIDRLETLNSEILIEIEDIDPGPIITKTLDRKEFRYRYEEPLFLKLNEWLSRFLPRFHGRFPKGLSYLIFFGILILVIYALVKILPNIKFKSETRLSSIPEETKTKRVDSKESLKDKAKEYLKTKRYRYAIRYLYLSLLVYLDEKGEIEYRQEKTNWEYLKEVKDLERYHTFGRLTSLFDRIWYGIRECGIEEYTEFHTHYNRMVMEA